MCVNMLVVLVFVIVVGIFLHEQRADVTNHRERVHEFVVHPINAPPIASEHAREQPSSIADEKKNAAVVGAEREAGGVGGSAATARPVEREDVAAPAPPSTVATTTAASSPSHPFSVVKMLEDW